MKPNRVVSQEAALSAGSSGAMESAERVLAIERIFDAPPSLVFKAWTDPQHLVHWYGPRGFTLPSCKLDLRPGGAWRSCMLSPEGREHWVRGVFREIVEPERLVFTLRCAFICHLRCVVGPATTRSSICSFHSTRTSRSARRS